MDEEGRLIRFLRLLYLLSAPSMGEYHASTMTTPDRLHYHVVAEGFDGQFTTQQPAAARKQKRLLEADGRRAFIYECSIIDPACPLVTGSMPRSPDG